METLLTLISVVVGSSGLSAIVVAILNHRWSAKKGTSTKLDGMIAGDNMEVCATAIGYTAIDDLSVRLLPTGEQSLSINLSKARD